MVLKIENLVLKIWYQISIQLLNVTLQKQLLKKWG